MPKIIIENENDRVFTPKHGVPTIRLGDGGTVICDVVDLDGVSGICFFDGLENRGVGGDHSELSGQQIDKLGAYLQILTDNPASIDVMIDKLQRAKAALSNSPE